MTVESTGATAAGTPYTTSIDTINGNLCRWSIRDGDSAGLNLRNVVYCHGAGGQANDFHGLSGWKRAREFALDNHGVIMECVGGPTTYSGRFHWGRDFMPPAYRDMYERVGQDVSLGETIIINTSMGRTASNRLFIYDDLIAPKAVGLIDTVGVYDLLREFQNGNHFDLAGFYGVPVGDDAAFMAATTLNDPARTDPAAWTGKNVYVYVGLSDTTATPAWHGLKFWGDYGPDGADTLGPLSRLEARAGAVHGSYPDPTQVLDFMADAWGIAPPDPSGGIVNRVIARYWMDDDRKLHRITSSV